MTNGPIPDEKLGYKWTDASGNHLSEDEFMWQHGINPRVEWCNRKNTANPAYKEKCKGKGKIEPAKYGVVPLKPHKRPDRPGATW
jgi:hypothetical protein